jgi:hypothetical protein
MLQDFQAFPSDISLDEPDATGSLGSSAYKVGICHLNQFIITVKLTPDNKFLDIIEIKVNKDFLSHKQKMASLSDFNVEAYLEP